MLATIIQRHDKKSFHFNHETLTEILQMPHFMTVLIPYINLLNFSWIIKCLPLRDMEPLQYLVEWQIVQTLIRLLLQEQSDQGLHCLHMSKILSITNLRTFTILKVNIVLLTPTNKPVRISGPFVSKAMATGRG